MAPGRELVRRTRGLRVVIFAVGFASLFGAGWGGLVRGGWPWPPVLVSLVVSHGALMASGFAGTLVALQRVVVYRRAWAYVVPVASAAAAIALAAGAAALADVLLALAAAALVAISLARIGAVPALSTLAAVSGALCWLAASVRGLLGSRPRDEVIWWIGFLVLTIVSERIELSRPLRERAGFGLTASAIALTVGGLALALGAADAGTRVTATGLIALALWVGFADAPPIGPDMPPLGRAVSIAIRSAYPWLALGAILLIIDRGSTVGPNADAAIHAIFVGFVLVMVFAHAPVVVPAVVGFSIDPRASFLPALALLQVSLALRAGAVLFGEDLRAWSGLLSAAAVLAFIATLAAAARRRRPGAPDDRAGAPASLPGA